jgi:glutathione peroxidase
MTGSDIYSIPLKAIDGRTTSLDEHKGKPILIVNVASRCGYTPQYEGLEQLYRKYRERGLVVLGFPCNQFGHQEPGAEAEIQSFCSLNYGVTFPMYAKIDVNGASAHPLYIHLKRSKRGILGLSSIKWNFTKFLLDRSGRVVRRFGPNTKPAKLEAPIEALL